MRTWDSRSRPEPKGLLGRRARRATPRSFPWSRVKKLTIKSASRKGYVRRTNVSLTRAGIESKQLSRLAREGHGAARPALVELCFESCSASLDMQTPAEYKHCGRGSKEV